MRLGDLDALKEIIETYRPILITSDYLQGKNNMVDYCIAEIDSAPTVEERPQGEWIATKYYSWACSKCAKNPTIGMGYVQNHKDLFNFYPHCGADMRGIKE